MKPISWRWPTLGLAVMLAGCASYPQQRGLDGTAELTAARGVTSSPPVDCTQADAGVAGLLREPLTLDAAIQITLICNPGLAAEYARLGIARADAFQAGRLANPGFSVARSEASGGGRNSVTFGIAQNFSQLILRGPRQRLSEGEFLRTQQLLAGRVLESVAATSAAWYGLLAAEPAARIAEASADAAEAAAELSQRYRDAGNRSMRELALDQAEAVEARIAARRASDAVAAARADLQRQLGLPATTQWTLPARLPLPAAETLAIDALRQQAAEQRLDLVAARGLVSLLADSREATRRWRWLGDFSVGVEREREQGGARTLEPQLSIQLPLFDRGQATLARADAWQEWSEAERRRLDLQVASAVELAFARWQSAQANVADHRDRLLPQRRNVVARTQEDVNYMLRGPFELLRARRDEYAAAIGYVEAIGAYWIARTGLEQAIGSRLPAAPDAGTIGADELVGGVTADPEPAHEHHDHEHHGEARPAAPDHSAMDHGAPQPAQPPQPEPQPGVQP